MCTREMEFGDNPLQVLHLKMRYQALNERSVETCNLFDECHKGVLLFPELHRALFPMLILELGERFPVLLYGSVVLAPHAAFYIVLACK